MKLLPIEHLILVPTLRSDSRYQFEKHTGSLSAMDTRSQ